MPVQHCVFYFGSSFSISLIDVSFGALVVLAPVATSLASASSTMADSPEQPGDELMDYSILSGLGEAWETDKGVRRKVSRNQGQLINWPNPKKHGVVDFPAMSANADVLCYLLEFWCPKAPDRKTPHVDFIKPQARHGKIKIKNQAPGL